MIFFKNDLLDVNYKAMEGILSYDIISGASAETKKYFESPIKASTITSINAHERARINPILIPDYFGSLIESVKIPDDIRKVIQLFALEREDMIIPLPSNF